MFLLPLCFSATSFFNSGSNPAPAPQENAELLTEEGKLLAGLQSAGSGGDEGGDYDMRAYAVRLEGLLRRKHDTTAALLVQIERFKRSLEHEEMLSTGAMAARH